MSERPEIAVSKRPPEFESAAAIYANKTVEEERARATPEKLERWIRDSIGEIVRNIENVVHIFSDYGGAAGLRLLKEAASREIWRDQKTVAEGEPKARRGHPGGEARR